MKDCIRPSSLVRRNLLSAMVGSAALSGLGVRAQSADSPLTILVGFPPGGNVDATARALAVGMQAALGRTVVIENRPGAGGQIAMQALTRAAKDGRTLMLSNEHAVSIIPQTFKSPGYDVARDLAPVATVVSLPLALAVHPSVNAKNLDEFFAWVRQTGKEVNIGVPAPASQPDFTIGLMARKYGVKVTAVPYRGGAPMVADLLGGHLHAGFSGISEFLPHVPSGKLRMIAVSGPKRITSLPDVGTFAEAGVQELKDRTFMGLFAPSGVPQEILQAYRQAVKKATASDAFQRALADLGLEANYGDAQHLRANVEDTIKTWGAIIRASGFTPQ